MSAASAVTICSNALLLCGQNAIASFDETTQGARLVANTWDTVRQATLRLGSWSCARRRANIGPDADAPPFDWGYKFSWPGDCLRVMSVGEAGESPLYEIEGRAIFMNENACKLRYIYDNTNPATWDSVLVEAVTYHMAAFIAYSITGSTTLREAMQANFASLLQAARGVNSDEAPVDPLGDNPLISVRMAGWGRGIR